MNIFYLDEDISKNVQSYCDKHIVKMILEQAQLLCSVFHLQGIKDVPYRLTHKNHPCAIWTRESEANFVYGYLLLTHLLIEYTYRYGKIHASTKIHNWISVNSDKLKFEKQEFTEPPKCMPDKYKVDSVVESYRNYYNYEKSSFAKWTKRPIPEWFVDKSKEVENVK